MNEVRTNHSNHSFPLINKMLDGPLHLKRRMIYGYLKFREHHHIRMELHWRKLQDPEALNTPVSMPFTRGTCDPLITDPPFSLQPPSDIPSWSKPFVQFTFLTSPSWPLLRCNKRWIFTTWLQPFFLKFWYQTCSCLHLNAIRTELASIIMASYQIMISPGS